MHCCLNFKIFTKRPRPLQNNRLQPHNLRHGNRLRKKGSPVMEAKQQPVVEDHSSRDDDKIDEEAILDVMGDQPLSPLRHCAIIVSIYSTIGRNGPMTKTSATLITRIDFSS
jgi:hypothetical protein